MRVPQSEDSFLSVSAGNVIVSLTLSSLIFYTLSSSTLALLPVLFLALYTYAKNKPGDKATATTFFSGFRVGGHRGSPYIFPENSLAGFVQAHKEGVDLIEFDVALTKDGYAVLLHDDDLDRTTNMTGPIRDKNLCELKHANIAAKFVRHCTSDADPVAMEGIPSLESVVEWSAKNNVKMLFDVKDYDPALVAIIVQLFDKYNLYSLGIVCSFFPWVVYRVKRADRRILTGLTWRQKFFSYKDNENTQQRFTGIRHLVASLFDFLHVFSLKTFLPNFLGADLLLTNNLDISFHLVSSQRRKGIEVVAWTVNDVSEMQWMLETLKIPILTDFPFHIKTLDSLRQFGHNGYVAA